MRSLEEYKKDLQSFADDENDVIVEKNGEILLSRFNREFVCKLVFDADGNERIEYDDKIIPYRQFLSKHLAGLDIFAQRIISKHPSPENFINGPSKLESVNFDIKNGNASELLRTACSYELPFTTKVVFLTADAGHGKTYLLKHFQYNQAKSFLEGNSKYLLWHIDLQGRQLLRLNEALMGSLGELRIAGIYMQSIITLLKHGLIVLAIDGFDELAAEQGSSDALGALSQLVKSLDHSGTIVAASRRSFFDAEEYLKRARMLEATVSSHSQYDQLSLLPWTHSEAINFLRVVKYEGRSIQNPSETYAEIVSELNNDEAHPLISRPFLLSQIAKALIYYNMTPASFIGGMQNPFEGVSSVVEAFIEREVTEKWIARETGKPYLTQEQHIRLLSQVADEMWYSQKEKLDLEIIQDILALLLDEWGIEVGLRPQIVEMVKMHVLLIPDGTNFRERRFEHPEFKNYFISRNLSRLMQNIEDKQANNELKRYLSVAQLPDSVAKYIPNKIRKLSALIELIVSKLENLVEDEWKPTYLNGNVGTILPYLINDINFENPVSFKAKAVYSSLVFENTSIANFSFINGNFINCRFVGIDWANMTFEKCAFHDSFFEYNPHIKNVVFKNCEFNSVILLKDGEEIDREYSPQRIINLLSSIGFSFYEEKIDPIDEFDSSNEKKLILKFFQIFRKTTRVTDRVIEIKFQPDQREFIYKILMPLAEKNQILEEIRWTGGGAAQMWMIKVRAKDLFQGQDISGDSKMALFWKEIRSELGY